jgi:flagellar basal body rod protein FlgG
MISNTAQICADMALRDLATFLHGLTTAMDALLIAAASGMKARMESLEMLANNLANQASPGYKTDRESYSLYVAPEALAGTGADVIPLAVTAPVIERHWTDFSQGSLTATSNPFDIALSGRGFFTVQGESGPLYTRNGHFRLSPAGRLETQDGFAVLDSENRPIMLNRAFDIEITPTGLIRQQGQPVAQLGLVDFADTEPLAKHAGTYFLWTGDAGASTPARAATLQGRLEGANQSPAEGAVRLITILRQFEMLQRAIQIGSEMNRRADEVARVAS